jgi:hypothetical protein
MTVNAFDFGFWMGFWFGVVITAVPLTIMLYKEYYRK